MGLTFSNGETVLIDTAPFIYFFEKNIDYHQKMNKIFDDIYQHDIQMIVSMITYMELITLPLREGFTHIVAKYRDYFTNSENLSLYPVNIFIAESAALFRAEYNIKTLDAILLATAKNCGVDYIITNDKSWKKISGMEIILLDEIE